MAGKEEVISMGMPDNDGTHYISKLNLPTGILLDRNHISQYGTKLPYSRYASFHESCMSGTLDVHPPSGDL